MLKPAPAKVNPACPRFVQKWLWGTSGPTWGKDLRTFSILFGLPALLIWLLALDTPLAHWAYHPEVQSAATFLRRNGTLPGTVLAVLCLFALFWPTLYKSRPLLYRAAVVVVLTTVFGVGLANQIIIKNLADRPRPQESVLIEDSTFADGFRGNSMPSGHAAMGFVLAAPFFPLRRSRPRLAATFLTAGIATGTIVGLSRMALGAHFATDVLVAGLITLASASLFTALSHRFTRIHPGLVGVGLLIAALAVVLGNRFTNLTLVLPLPEPIKSIHLPCQPTAISTPGTAVPTLTVSLSGYGAPLSLLKIDNNQGIITLQRHFGLYHNLTCTAEIRTPIPD